MPNYSRVAVAKQEIAKRIDQITDNGHYMMVRQVHHEDIPTDEAPTTLQHPQKLSSSPPRIYSPTSASLCPQRPLKVSGVAASARILAPTQQIETTVDTTIRNTTNISRLTPTQEFERILDQDLEAKTKAEVQRAARWYRWW